jgi:hypothetical protein
MLFWGADQNNGTYIQYLKAYSKMIFGNCKPTLRNPLIFYKGFSKKQIGSLEIGFILARHEIISSFPLFGRPKRQDIPPTDSATLLTVPRGMLTA